jgi:hypothetical protein
MAKQPAPKEKKKQPAKKGEAFGGKRAAPFGSKEREQKK